MVTERVEIDTIDAKHIRCPLSSCKKCVTYKCFLWEWKGDYRDRGYCKSGKMIDWREKNG